MAKKGKKGRTGRRIRLLLVLLLLGAGLVSFALAGHRLVSHSTARPAGSCRAILDEVSAAVDRCAVEGRLEQESRVLLADLVDRSFLKHPPVCPWGGRYGDAFVVGQKPSCSARGVPGHDQLVHVYELGPFAWELDQRGVCRFRAWEQTVFWRPDFWPW